jgi:deoxycytidine triphosphate deaminase
MATSNTWFVPDPFPNVPCALLHSGDVRRYAEHAASSDRLFTPFNAKKLKSASYEVPFRGVAYWWDAGSSGRKDQQLGDGSVLRIPRNGIVFVQPEVIFNVPPYLALRFNLHIRLVHRGLLLGTGPLVDPGFRGQLLIPVHNLTDEDVFVNADDGFIWIEVTKVSPLVLDVNGEVPGYVPFPPEKRDLPAWRYFDRARSGDPIRSSMHSIEEDVDRAKGALKEHERVTLAATALAVVGVVFGLGAIAWASIAVWNDTRNFVVDAAKTQSTSASPVEAGRLDELAKRVRELEEEVDKLRRKTADPSSTQGPREVRRRLRLSTEVVE